MVRIPVNTLRGLNLPCSRYRAKTGFGGKGKAEGRSSLPPSPPFPRSRINHLNLIFFALDFFNGDFIGEWAYTGVRLGRQF